MSVLRKSIHTRSLVALVILAPMVSGCGGVGALSDFSLKDQEWFARPGKIFKGNSTIETPPLSVSKEVTPNDLISSDGQCPGMPAPGAPADANASEGQVSVAPVALGHTECDVARAIAVAPDNVNLSNNERGDRVAQITWRTGPRPGAYTFTSGRLTSIERVDVPPPEKPARGAKKKRA
ncbi:MAG: hypothetical protein IJ127_11245 [Afipia sp.]|nr:hypothetical protein [Afipia sp.]MBS4005319.1 hypothetical protein [Afipia sp.]